MTCKLIKMYYIKKFERHDHHKWVGSAVPQTHRSSVLDMGIPPFEFLVRDALEYLRTPQCFAIFSGSWAELSDKPILLKISYFLVRGHKEIKL